MKDFFCTIYNRISGWLENNKPKTPFLGKFFLRVTIFFTISLLVSLIIPKFPFYFMVIRGQCPLTKFEGNTNLYSQFYEDYVLSNVFKDVHKGTYIDVGASDPDYLSVTKHFYLKGWSGINIEPLPHMYELLESSRPNDINLNVGISDKNAELEFYQIYDRSEKEPSVYSTFNPNIKDTASKKGFQIKVFKIPVTTLNFILGQHPIQTINFLKIDVEGFEKNVLKGLDLEKFRPEVLVIEATIPSTYTPSHQEWESIILNNNYSFQFTDKLNRYYLRNESQHLKQNFENIQRCVFSHER